MKYVEFGAQENRDFDYEKFVIGERIQLLENQMRYKEESTGKFINVIKDLVIQIQTLGLAFFIIRSVIQIDTSKHVAWNKPTITDNSVFCRD